MMHLAKQFEHLKVHLEAIKFATNNFADDNCIGRGGFGKVYKGELLHSRGQSVVALKRFDPMFGQGNPEFWKEIIMLSLYKHENIVSLLGFCDEDNEKILVYEYASRRSLDLYLNNDDLTWTDRLKICVGAARGLAYLHNPGGTQQRLLHRDIKSSNILLDENWMQRFRISVCPNLVSNTLGTIGYCDPLYIETGLLTKESDVYSFGVVLFEVFCGRLSISDKSGAHQSLTALVKQYYAQNKIKEIIYGSIKDRVNPMSLEAFTTIAYQCLDRDLQKRPLMTEVMDMLESAIAYQLMTPKEVQSRIVKRLQHFVDEELVDEQGVPNILVWGKLFRRFDTNGDNRLSKSELRAVFDGINSDEDDVVEMILKDFDTSHRNEISFIEIITGIMKWHGRFNVSK